jgi:hypothetical protein
MPLDFLGTKQELKLQGESHMTTKADEAIVSTSSPPTAPEEPKKTREIPGNLPYTTSFGVLKKALDGIINAERPDKFSGDFMDRRVQFHRF